jgi:SnoaL-like domain
MESDRNKAEVVATMVRFWQVYERKDLAALSNMLTTVDDFTFFGSDAAEVVKTPREWNDAKRLAGQRRIFGRNRDSPNTVCRALTRTQGSADVAGHQSELAVI